MAILNEKSLIVGQVNVLITYIYTSIGMFVVRDLNFFSKLQSLSMNVENECNNSNQSNNFRKKYLHTEKNYLHRKLTHK